MAEKAASQMKKVSVSQILIIRQLGYGLWDVNQLMRSHKVKSSLLDIINNFYRGCWDTSERSSSIIRAKRTARKSGLAVSKGKGDEIGKLCSVYSILSRVIKIIQMQQIRRLNPLKKPMQIPQVQ